MMMLKPIGFLRPPGGVPEGFVTEITMGSVTFTFSEPVVAGLDQTGRAYVVDPGDGVTVTAISPAQTTDSGNIVNGAQKNFAIGEDQGLDQRLISWNSGQNDTPSISLVAGDKITKVISDLDAVLSPTDRDGAIAEFACLHCVTTAPTANQVLGPTLTWTGDTTPEVYDFNLDAFYAARTTQSSAGITWPNFSTLTGYVGQFWPTYAAINTDEPNGYETFSPREFGGPASTTNVNYGRYIAETLGDLMLITTVAAGSEFTEAQIKQAIRIAIMHGIEWGVPFSYAGPKVFPAGAHAQFHQGPSLLALQAIGLSAKIPDFIGDNGACYLQAIRIESLADFAPHTDGTKPWFTRQRTLSTQPGGSTISIPFNIPAGYGSNGFDMRRDAGMPVGTRIIRLSDGVTATMAEAFSVPDTQGDPVYLDVALTGSNPFSSGNVVYMLPPVAEPLQVGSYDWTVRSAGVMSNFSPYFNNGYRPLQRWGASLMALRVHGVTHPLLDSPQGYFELAGAADRPSSTNDYVPLINTTAADGYYTNRWTSGLSVLTAPSAFTAGHWSVVPDGTVTISTLPSNGGALITGIDYRLDGGSWTAASGITEFSVVNGRTITFTIPAYSDQDVEIRAKNVIGDSLPSDVKVGSAAVPSAFVDANWSVDTGTGDATLDVTIDSLPANNGASIIRVEYDLNGSGTWIDSGGTTSFTITGLSPSTSYDVRLRAVNSVGNGSPGNTETATSSAATGPALLFAASEQGGWYDPSDLSTMFKDTAGTDPVTADGDPVARINDKSGRGNHLTQGTSANRPVYKTSGGLHWLEFDGSNDCLFTASAFNMAGSDKLTIWAGVRRDMDDDSRILVELSPSLNTNAATFAVSAPEISTRLFGSAARGTNAVNTGHLAFIGTGNAAPDLAVITATHDIAGDRSKIWRNRILGTDGTFDKGSGNFASTQALFVGARNNASLRFQGRLYSLIIRGGASSSGEIANTEDYVAAKTGVTL